jgi:hypothetical protein
VLLKILKYDIVRDVAAGGFKANCQAYVIFLYGRVIAKKAMLALILPSLTEAKPKLQFGFHLNHRAILGPGERGVLPIMAANTPIDYC